MLHFLQNLHPLQKKTIEINSLINIITAVSETTDLELQTVCVLFKVTDRLLPLGGVNQP